MPQINKQAAREFLDNITSKDKIAIIHHDDGDGFCSGILLYDHAKSKGATIETFPYNLSDSSLENLPLKPFNKIIITDISSKATQEEIKSIQEKQILYIDHHPKFPLPDSVLQLITVDEGYFPTSKTIYEILGQKKWLAIIGTISDSAQFYKENDNFINTYLESKNTNLKQFQEEYVFPLTNVIICLKQTPEKIFPVLEKISSLEEIKTLKKYSEEIENELKKYGKKYEEEKEKFGDISLFYYEPKFSINKPLINMISRKYPERVQVFMSPNKEYINIGTRDQSEKIGVNLLLETATKNLENSKSGGHRRASGGTIMKKDLEKFKQNLKDYLKK
jgi:single-stranded DNA-specific DHH superfamily exonuclease